MAILISGKIDFEANKIIRLKEDKRIHPKEDIANLNVETTEFQNIRNKN